MEICTPSTLPEPTTDSQDLIARLVRRHLATLDAHSFHMDGERVAAVLLTQRRRSLPFYMIAWRDDLRAWLKEGYSLQFYLRQHIRGGRKQAEVCQTRGSKGGHNTNVMLGRWFLDLPSDESVDYINGNPLDLRRSNLKVITYYRKERQDRTRDICRENYRAIYPVTSIADRLIPPSAIDFEKLHILT